MSNLPDVEEGSAPSGKEMIVAALVGWGLGLLFVAPLFVLCALGVQG